MHQQKNDPEKRKAAPTSKSNAASLKQQMDCTSPNASRQGVSKYSLIWAAAISPPATKLVLLAMANYSDSDGTNIRPSVATVAGHCGLSAKQTRRHIHDLIGSAVLVPTATPERATHTYKLSFSALAALRSTPAHGSSPTPAHGSSKTAIYSHGCPNLLPPMGAYPNDPDLSQGREGAVPSGSVATPPTRGPSVGLPGELRKDLFDALVANGPMNQSRIDALVEKAHELVGQGHDVNAMAQMAIECGWKRWGRPPAPTAPPKPYKRTTSRAGAKEKALRLGEATDWEMPAPRGEATDWGMPA